MTKSPMIKYNLQFFSEGTDPTPSEGTDPTPSEGTDPTPSEGDPIDVQAFADLISEKDKEIQQLQKDIAELKKSNAQLTVRVNAGQKPVEFNTEKAILEFCDTRKVH